MLLILAFLVGLFLEQTSSGSIWISSVVDTPDFTGGSVGGALLEACSSLKTGAD